MDLLNSTLKTRALSETDAFALWMGLELHSRNPWSLAGDAEVTLALSRAFSQATKDYKKSGNARDGFTFRMLPN